MTRVIRSIGLMLLSSLLIQTNANAEQVIPQKPVVYSYWAGWSNEKIPHTQFNGLFLAFAMLRSNGQHYYTDYKASGNFQEPSDQGPYTLWTQWWHDYWNQGGRAYVSYGGGTNDEFRGMIINATDQQLDSIAGEIKANIAKYSFDGVDLDIENWWNYNQEDNQKFASNLAKMVKILRKSLDDDLKTQQKPIMLAVGWEAAGAVNQMNGNSAYAGSMAPFFTDSEAMDALSDINIMSYNTGIPNFYSRYDLIDGILNQFKALGIPQQKLIFGIQPCESGGFTPVSTDTLTQLAHHIKEENYGGLFLWGIGTGGNCGQASAEVYINIMMNGLSN